MGKGTKRQVVLKLITKSKLYILMDLLNDVITVTTNHNRRSVTRGRPVVSSRKFSYNNKQSQAIMNKNDVRKMKQIDISWSRSRSNSELFTEENEFLSDSTRAKIILAVTGIGKKIRRKIDTDSGIFSRGSSEVTLHSLVSEKAQTEHRGIKQQEHQLR